jgi:hypothetical protein
MKLQEYYHELQLKKKLDVIKIQGELRMKKRGLDRTDILYDEEK